MRIYFSGIGGVGIGPLALIAHDAGYDVCGSDRETSLTTAELETRAISFSLSQDGNFLRQQHQKQPIDWFVYTAALAQDHPELVLARQLGIRTAKRDELLAHIIDQKKLKLIAVAGTHGKTTTTGMLVWAMQQLGIQTSYSVGSTLSFGPSGLYLPDSTYFVYECDEFDRNFLHFKPWLSLITTIEHDHSDTYATKSEYFEAFRQFSTQSDRLVTWEAFRNYLDPQTPSTFCSTSAKELTLTGAHNRDNATLALQTLSIMHPADTATLANALNSFPGTNRRFEALASNLYSDYGHHPTEIAATLQMARELRDQVVLVYQPHQNVRQHEIKDAYTDCMDLADEIYWLPTYLSREDPTLEILTPQQLTRHLPKTTNITYAQPDNNLWNHIQTARQNGKLVLIMGAGSIDNWAREQLRSQPENEPGAA